MTNSSRPEIALRLTNSQPVIKFVFDSQQDVLDQINNSVKLNQHCTDFEAYTYLKYKVNQTNKTYNFVKLGTQVEIQLGQFLTSSKQLQLAFNWSREKVRYWLSKMVKKGILTIKIISNKFGYKIGTLITCNKFRDFRESINLQYEAKKQLGKNCNHRLADTEATKSKFTPNKIINKETKENNENLLIFNTNKKLFDFNAKILEEKRKQEEELINLRISLKKEKTQNKQLKALKKFEVTGKIETKSIQFNWDFQKTVEYKQIAEKLKAFGFEQYAINKLWWKSSRDIQRLIDFIDYTQMKYEQGKVNDPKKFLYHALLASYDLGELERMRCDAKSREEKDRIENDKMMEDIRLRQEHERAKELQQQQEFEEFGKITKWIQNNQSHTIYDDIIIKLQAENKFLHDLFCKKARRSSIFGVANYLKSVKSSKMDLCVSGLYTKVKAIMKVSVMA